MGKLDHFIGKTCAPEDADVVIFNKLDELQARSPASWEAMSAPLCKVFLKKQILGRQRGRL
eukprot:6453270-Amphidinium_carterae.1